MSSVQAETGNTNTNALPSLPGQGKVRSLLLILCLIFSFFQLNLSAQVTRYSVANGSWNSTASWSATSGGASGASIPVAGDIVYIEEAFDITVTGTQACDSVIILGNDGTNSTELIVDGGTLNVGGGMFISGEGGATTYSRDGRFIVENSGIATLSGNVSLLADERNGDINVETNGVLTINGDVSLTSTRGGRRSELEVDDASLNINGDINFLGALGMMISGSGFGGLLYLILLEILTELQQATMVS